MKLGAKIGMSVSQILICVNTKENVLTPLDPIIANVNVVMLGKIVKVKNYILSYIFLFFLTTSFLRGPLVAGSIFKM